MTRLDVLELFAECGRTVLDERELRGGRLRVMVAWDGDIKAQVGQARTTHGKCRKCEAPLASETFCARCLGLQRKHNAACTSRRLHAGKCTRCGKACPTGKRCDACRAKHAANQRASAARKRAHAHAQTNVELEREAKIDWAGGQTRFRNPGVTREEIAEGGK